VKENASSKPERTIARSEHGDRSLTISDGYAKDAKTGHCVSKLEHEGGGCIADLHYRPIRGRMDWLMLLKCFIDDKGWNKCHYQ